MSKRFALTGAAGYVAPRHLKAIKNTGSQLVAALDPNDSVGILDSYFFDADFFTEFERFDRHLEKLKRLGEGNKIDYLSICSPNYLHDAHIRMALRIGADAICEKPLVLNPWNIDALQEIEQESGKKVYTILQLRVHDAIKKLKEKYVAKIVNGKKDIDLTYITSRGKWYLRSWKGQLEKSGGVATNIGVHFFDMLIWLFGPVEVNEIHYTDEKTVSGYLELEHARVKWFLSFDHNTLPEKARADGKPTYRSITIDEEEIEFSTGFTDLHTLVYQETLSGNGFTLDDARPAIELVHDIRVAPVIGKQKHSHSFLLG
jgi:UDP-N-acetyl-2-amino-2-deoxyglucuronate dehydrogenase